MHAIMYIYILHVHVCVAGLIISKNWEFSSILILQLTEECYAILLVLYCFCRTLNSFAAIPISSQFL